MPENGVRSTYSQCPFQIYLCDDEGIISTGSGFFYTTDNQWYLITNWHNFSGRHFLTKEPLGSSGRFPTYIQAKFSSYVITSPERYTGKFTTVAQRVEIYKDYEPLWLEHPTLGSTCDVVALPIERPERCPEFMHNAANLIGRIRIPVKPGCTSFIIGFPRSISVGFGLPLWKAGYIASEPFYDVTIGGELSEVAGMDGGVQLPAFFIDSQTREGMSGSPVFASYTGNWDSSNPYESPDVESPDFWQRDDIMLGENRMEFVGCYSGRIGQNEERAALGLCWREDTIKAICLGECKGLHPHINPVVS